MKLDIDLADILALIAFGSFVAGLGLYDYRAALIGGGGFILLILTIFGRRKS